MNSSNPNEAYRATRIREQIAKLQAELSDIETPSTYGIDGVAQVRSNSLTFVEEREFERNRIHQMFTYHPPRPDQLPRYAAINQAFENAALIVLDNVKGRDRETAIECLSQARMIANRGIALEG